MSSSSEFIFFHVPVASGQFWVPGAIQAPQQHLSNIQDRSLQIDQFVFGLVLSILLEQQCHPHEIVNSYFKYIHPWFPIIHQRNFRLRLSQSHQAPRAATALLLLSLYLVIPTCSSNTTQSNSETYVYSLCKYLFSFLQLHCEPCVETVQSGLLLVLYELGSSLVTAASIAIGSCARIAQIMDLHSSTSPQTEVAIGSWVDQEEKKRVWLGTYMLDRCVNPAIHGFSFSLVTATWHLLIECCTSLVLLAERNHRVPPVLQDLEHDTLLPVDDLLWNRCADLNFDKTAQPSLSTRLDHPVCYFAREIQAIHLLSQVQKFQIKWERNKTFANFEGLGTTLQQLVQALCDQTPGSWVVFCGANALAFM